MTFPENTSLPTHPRTGLQAVGIVGGKPVWPILGGDGTGDAGSATGQQNGGGTATADAGAQNGSQAGAANAANAANGANGQQGNGTSDGGAATGQQNSGDDKPKPGPPTKTFTQADLDSAVQKRMTAYEKSLGTKLAGLFGDPDGGDGKGAPKPDDVLKQITAQLDGVRQQANTATAEALARAAGIKDERLGTFIGLAMNGALTDVDPADPAAVKAAIKTAVDARAAEFPEWKTTATAAASGGDRGQAPGGKKTYTKAQLEAMSQDELAANADEILAAGREGRIS